MTNEMSSDEINEAVAKKLGWIKFDEHYQYWIPPTIEAMHKYGDKPSHLPLYAKTIAAAWEIVEKHKQAEYKNEDLFFQMAYYDDKYKWEAGWFRYQDCGIVTHSADTAPMAICLAFLKLNDA